MGERVQISNSVFRTEPRIRILAVTSVAALILSVTIPLLTRAQEVLSVPPQYYQDLESYLSSPEAGRDAAVPVSPEELDLVHSPDSF